jgi:hypothetical protein
MTFLKSMAVSACAVVGIGCVVGGFILGTFLNELSPIFGYAFAVIGAWLALATICWLVSNGDSSTELYG